MEYIDVIFPLNLGPLTYRVPDSLRESVRPGAAVRAQIKKAVKEGIVLRPALNPPDKKFKEVEGLADAPPLSAPLLSLITWMSGYYLSTEGAVLKGILPEEYFKLKTEKTAIPSAKDTAIDAGLPDELRKNLGSGIYKTFLHHAASTGHELSFLIDAVSCLKSVIILCPELEELKAVAPILMERLGDRLAIFHGSLKKSARIEALQKITSGAADIILGSRSAVFAPLSAPSMIAVLHEESASYKEEGGVRYNARDMAVMRGYLEGATVLLSSICPSVESAHNASTGKYTLIKPAVKGLSRRPKVRVIDVRKSKSFISFKLLSAAEARLKKGERVLFLINKKGYSMLQCGDCGRLEECPNCAIPLSYHKSEKSLRCGYCGLKSAPPDTCPSCGGLPSAAGAGIERIEEEAQKLTASRTEGIEKLKVLEIGDRRLGRHPELRDRFSVLGAINADSFLYTPDFRSMERAFSDLVYSAETIKPGGELIVQTRNPYSPLFRYLRRFDFEGFYKGVLAERKALEYPPFSKMALITFLAGGTGPRAGQYGEEPGFLKGLERACAKHGVRLLGPALAITRRGKKVRKILLKADSGENLRKALAAVKGESASIDIDPLFI